MTSAPGQPSQWTPGGCFHELGVLCVAVFIIRALRFDLGPGFLETPICCPPLMRPEAYLRYSETFVRSSQTASLGSTKVPEA